MSSSTIAVLENSEAGALLIARTLRRKFPSALIITGITSDSAISLASDDSIGLYIVHRVGGEDAATVVKRIKERRPRVPVIMVSAVDRRQEAAEAEADEFLLFEQWLMLAPTVERLLQRAAGTDPA